MVILTLSLPIALLSPGDILSIAGLLTYVFTTLVLSERLPALSTATT